MIKWIEISSMLPRMEDSISTIEVLMWFGSHAETGKFFFDENGSPYHVFYDGDSLSKQPTHWAEINTP